MRCAVPARLFRPLTVAALLAGLLATLVAPALASPLPSGTYGANIDAYARYEGQSQCLSEEQPGVRDFRALLQRTYGANGGGILRNCSQGGKSEHKEGRAYDWMLNANNASDRRKADEVLGWLLATDEHGNRHAMARRLGIMYIIWNRQVWNAYRPDEGWRPYTGASPHTDHIHFSFTWDGALRRTSYWRPLPDVNSSTPASTSGPFRDVPADAWHHDAVLWMVGHDITGGVADGSFGSSRPVTRAQMAAFLWRTAGKPAPRAPHTFGDVPADAYYADAVAWLQQAGVVTGTRDGRFDPSATVTRGQMASFLWRFVGSPAPAGRHPFIDVRAREHFDPAVAFLTEHGVVTGKTATEYAPTDRVTRAQTAALLWRLAGTQAAWTNAAHVPATVRF
ncbi:S-layer homology domain-containing protein [Egicoccus sp. AB-alg2]|uniref:S-layer homology domain-containing protein n=1 Tax=Egicoccus sp. AB-alg2 TaxID=3242693 RepID=UPI00359E3E8B